MENITPKQPQPSDTDLAVEYAGADGNSPEKEEESLLFGYSVLHTDTTAASCRTVISGEPWLTEEEERARLSDAVTALLRQFFALAGVPNPRKLLFAGLGNGRLTADALGSMTADRLLVNGGDGLSKRLGLPLLFAVKPGVPAQTGISTGTRLRLLTEALEPEVLLTVDAAAARHPKRLGTVIQITDAGVTPGSGVGVHGEGITAETMGCPVISMVVPTVIRSTVLLRDRLAEHGLEVPKEEPGFLVTRPETDLISECYGEILARGINRLILP